MGYIAKKISGRQTLLLLVITGIYVCAAPSPSTDGHYQLASSYLSSATVSGYRLLMPVASLALAGHYREDGAATQEQQVYAFTLSHPSCTRYSNFIRCSISVTNTFTENISIRFEPKWYDDYSVVSDDEGNQYRIDFPETTKLVPYFQTPHPIRINFTVQNVPLTTKRIAFILVAHEYPSNPWTGKLSQQDAFSHPLSARFENIPLVDAPPIPEPAEEPKPRLATPKHYNEPRPEATTQATTPSQTNSQPVPKTDLGFTFFFYLIAAAGIAIWWAQKHFKKQPPAPPAPTESDHILVTDQAIVTYVLLPTLHPVTGEHEANTKLRQILTANPNTDLHQFEKVLKIRIVSVEKPRPNTLQGDVIIGQ
jgi:hypothetical protein